MFKIHGFLEQADLIEINETQRMIKYLTMSSVFREILSEQGNLINIPKPFNSAKNLLTITNYKNYDLDKKFINKILETPQFKKNLLTDIKNNISNFEGICIDFENIDYKNLDSYIDLIKKIKYIIKLL